MKDLFDIFQKKETMEVDDVADFQVLLLDEDDPAEALMAVTALTIYQLEHGYDRGRFQMLLWAMGERCHIYVQIRAMVGLVLVCGRLDIKDEWALEQMAEVLSRSDNYSMAFESWYAILESGKPEKYDPNFEMVRPLYNTRPFTESPELFFQPFERGRVENLDDLEWKVVEMFFEALNVCDSDKYALLLVLKQYMPVIVQQLREQGIDVDDLESIDMNFHHMIMMSNGAHQLQRNTRELTPMEEYVQQLYRFIRLSRFTSLRVSENISELKKTMIHRMVVVGSNLRNEIEKI